MNKITLILILLLAGCSTFRTNKKNVVYFLPYLVEDWSNKHLEEVKKENVAPVFFYAFLHTKGISSDTFLLSIYHIKLDEELSKFIDLINSSNRFIKIGENQLPLIFYEDFVFSDIINVKNDEGGIDRLMHRGNHFSILFSGRSYEQGEIFDLSK